MHRTLHFRAPSMFALFHSIFCKQDQTLIPFFDTNLFALFILYNILCLATIFTRFVFVCLFYIDPFYVSFLFIISFTSSQNMIHKFNVCVAVLICVLPLISMTINCITFFSSFVLSWTVDRTKIHLYEIGFFSRFLHLPFLLKYFNVFHFSVFDFFNFIFKSSWILFLLQIAVSNIKG